MALLAYLWPKSRRAWALTSTMGAALLALAGVGAWLWWDSQLDWTAAELERLIKKELSPDCDRQEVEAWFDRHGIPHTYNTDTNEDRYMGFTMPALAGLGDRSLSGLVRGVVHRPDDNPGGFIDVYFFFDLRGCCAGYLVFPFEYAP
jgi:hypothetical protein